MALQLELIAFESSTEPCETIGFFSQTSSPQLQHRFHAATNCHVIFHTKKKHEILAKRQSKT